MIAAQVDTLFQPKQPLYHVYYVSYRGLKFSSKPSYLCALLSFSRSSSAIKLQSIPAWQEFKCGCKMGISEMTIKGASKQSMP